MIFENERIRFDTEQYDFASLVEQEIHNHLEANGHQVLPPLAQIHQVEGIQKQIEQYRQLLFGLFRKPNFQRLYCSFGKKLIDEHFTKRALIQKTPTVRIHLSGGKSVSFHSDAWYGHGRRVYSFWLPLTEVFGTNSLQMARSVDESRAFLASVGRRQLDLDEINVHAAKICEPIDASYGDMIVFNADMVHGTTNNETPQSRVSFDFRIAESVDDIGTKPAANFYTYDQLSASTDGRAEQATPARCYRSLMYSGICRGISAKSQLVFLNEYAKINHIDIVGSESEVVVFDYAPVLQTYVKNPPPNIDSILLFGTDLLPGSAEIREKIYHYAIESGTALIFGAEDFVLSSEEDIEKIERFFRPLARVA